MDATCVISALDARVRAAGQEIVDRRPELTGPFLRARDLYARTVVRARVTANNARYDAPIEPYRLIEVDPARIEYVAELPYARYQTGGSVWDGDWDRTERRFEDFDVYRAYERHFREGVPWEETAFFDRIVSEIRSGTVRWGCTSREEFEERCERLDRLYESIEANGYYSQAELREGAVADPITEQHPLKTERMKDEIAVHVGRDGRLLFEDGRNRLSIVKLLGLESVPVLVQCRHHDWQAIRDAYVRGESVPDGGAIPGGRDHPDLRYLSFDGG